MVDAVNIVSDNHLFTEEGMGTKECLEALDSVVSKRYPKQMYRIGGYQEAAICLQPKGNGWVVYNGERGNMYFEVQCNTILKACLEFIRKFTHNDSEIETMEKEFIHTYDKAIAEGSYEKALKIAEKMIKAKEPIEKIELYTELKLADIKPLAEKLGVSLVI